MILVAGATKMRARFRALLLSGALSLIAIAQPAEARRFRIFGIPHFGGGESIEQVYDLPDEAPFVKDGQNLDLGYLHGNSKSGFVLYVGDRYRLIDDTEIRMLKDLLGVDPTAKYRADHAEEYAAAAAEAKAERDHKDELIAKGRMIERAPGESSEAYKQRSAAFLKKVKADQAARDAKRGAVSPDQDSSSSGGSGLVMTFGLLAMLVLAFRRKIMGVIFGAARSISEQPDAGHGAPITEEDYGSFDERVARQLATVREGGEASRPVAAQPQMQTSYIAPPSAPVARGFGRKIA
jgi:hypothetical protein